MTEMTLDELEVEWQRLKRVDRRESPHDWPRRHEELEIHHRTTRFQAAWQNRHVEVDQQCDSQLRDPQPAHSLRLVDRMKTLDCLQLQHEPTVDDQIQAMRIQSLAVIAQRETTSHARTTRPAASSSSATARWQISSMSPGPSARCTSMQQPIVRWMRSSVSQPSGDAIREHLQTVVFRGFVLSWQDQRAPESRLYGEGRAVGVHRHRAVLVGPEDLRADRLGSARAPPAPGDRSDCSGRR